MSDATLHGVECIVLTSGVLVWALVLVQAALQRTRPEFTVRLPSLAGAGVRVLAIGGISATGIGQTLRGGDELSFLAQAHQIATTAWSSGDFLSAFTGTFHVWAFAAQVKLADLTDTGLRIAQVTFVCVGLLLLAAAAYDLGSPRSAWLVACLLAVDPAGIFFAGILHKEPLMILASGLVVFGATQLWCRGPRPTALVLMTSGGAIGVATRPYAGWFLVAGGVAVALHSSLAGTARRRLASVAVLVGTLGALIFAAPVVLRLSSNTSLKNNLQSSQEANSSDTSNLRLERVDFSSRAAVIQNLPQRVAEILVRPYPWQLGNTSQRLGAIGTLFSLAVLIYVGRLCVLLRGRVFRHGAPVLYPLLMLLMAYSLSAGNAGTGFRYRTHVVVLAVVLAGALRTHLPRRRQEHAVETRAVVPQPVALAGSDISGESGREA